MVMEKLLEKLRCRTITVSDGAEATRVAMSDIKFDIIMMEFKLPSVNGADVARMPADRVAAYVEQVPVKRLGQPEEVAALAAFLASEESGFITGDVYDVNGGMLMR